MSLFSRLRASAILSFLTILTFLPVRASGGNTGCAFTPPDLNKSPNPVINTVSAKSVYWEVLSSGNGSGLQDSIYGRRNIFRKLGDYFSESNIDKTQYKKMDFSIIGGPSYSSNIKFALGLVAAGLYRIDRSDLSIPPSNVSIYSAIATSGFWMLGVGGNTYFEGGKYRIDYNTSFISMPSDFWGVGYRQGLDNPRSDFKRVQAKVVADFMYRIAPNLYIGANVWFNYMAGKNFSDPDYVPAGQKTTYTNSGIGPFMQYDSRDVVTNAHRGWFVKLSYNFFPAFFGNDPVFSRTELTVDYYHRLWEGAVMAYDVHGIYNSGDTPWTMLAMMGGAKRMRGYYEGRFRDKGLMEAQVELRQKVWHRIGVTVWGGAGNVFPRFSEFKWSQTLPNYGVGFRWEFKNRVNVRLDYGFGKNQSGFIFNINEAF